MKRSAVKAAITMMAIGLGALTSSCVESAGSYQPSFFSYPNYDRDGEVGHWNVDNWNDIDVRP